MTLVAPVPFDMGHDMLRMLVGGCFVTSLSFSEVTGSAGSTANVGTCPTPRGDKDKWGGVGARARNHHY